jgi:uncharacterized membrane protein
MALFRHPSLVRGIVHTSHGAFVVVRSLVDLSDEIGEALGWESVDGATVSASTPVRRPQVGSSSTPMERLDAN